MLAHRCTWGDDCVIAVHNLSSAPVTVPITLDETQQGWRLIDLLRDGECDLDDQGCTQVQLEGYDFRWLRPTGPDDRRLP